MSQRAAIAALSGNFECVSEMRQSFIRRRDLALEIISSWPGVVCPKPDGAFYLFPSFAAYLGGECKDSGELCEKILEEAEVALVPGTAFGQDDCIRFSYAVADDVLTNGLARVGKVLEGVEK